MALNVKEQQSKKHDYQVTSDGRVKVRASTLLADKKVQEFYKSLKRAALRG